MLAVIPELEVWRTERTKTILEALLPSLNRE